MQEYLDQLLVELDEALGSEWWLDPAKRIAATREDPVLFAWVYLRHHLRLGERGPITWAASQALVRRDPIVDGPGSRAARSSSWLRSSKIIRKDDDLVPDRPDVGRGRTAGFTS